MLLARGTGIRHLRSSAHCHTFRSKARGGQDARGHPVGVGSSSRGSGQPCQDRREHLILPCCPSLTTSLLQDPTPLSVMDGV